VTCVVRLCAIKIAQLGMSCKLHELPRVAVASLRAHDSLFYSLCPYEMLIAT